VVALLFIIKKNTDKMKAFAVLATSAAAIQLGSTPAATQGVSFQPAFDTLWKCLSHDAPSLRIKDLAYGVEIIPGAFEHMYDNFMLMPELAIDGVIRAFRYMDIPETELASAMQKKADEATAAAATATTVAAGTFTLAQKAGADLQAPAAGIVTHCAKGKASLTTKQLYTCLNKLLDIKGNDGRMESAVKKIKVDKATAEAGVKEVLAGLKIEKAD